MGVPGFHSWIKKKYPSIITHMEVETDYEVDNLYLDFNTVIHPCINEHLKSLTKVDEDLYDALERYVDALVAYVKPRKMIYLAVDGVAPRAKSNEERRRRFKGARDNFDYNIFYLNEHEKLEGDSTQLFDPSSITPGVEFMQRLDEFLQSMISYKMSTDEMWKDKSVIYSGYLVPGEGEHKLFDYMRENKLNKQGKSESHLCFSCDSDLIMLGLTMPDLKIKIMSEDTTFHQRYISPEHKDYMQAHFSFVDVNMLEEFIKETFKKDFKSENFDFRRVLSDFVFLCFTIGNDFLPCAPCFDVYVDAVGKVAEYLTETILKCKDYITHPDGSINYKVLQEFFAICSVDEIANLKVNRKNLIRTRRYFKTGFDPHVEFEVTTPAGKQKYYKEKLHVNNEKELNAACAHYIEGMVWIYKYYFFGCASWDFYYQYYFAPFMAELKDTQMHKVEFPPSTPELPFEQLLSVLPAMSMQLLPPSFRALYYDEGHIVLTEEFKESLKSSSKSKPRSKATSKSKGKDEYLSKLGYFRDFNKIYAQAKTPDLEVGEVFDFTDFDFKQDGFMKSMPYQFVSLLPPVDYAAVKAFAEKQEKYLTPKEKERNTRKTERFYSNKPALLSKEKAMYAKESNVLKDDAYEGIVYTPHFDLISNSNNNAMNKRKKTKLAEKPVGARTKFKRVTYTSKVVVFDFDQKNRAV